MFRNKLEAVPCVGEEVLLLMTYKNRHLKNIFLTVHLATQAGASVSVKHPSRQRMGTRISGSVEKESS